MELELSHARHVLRRGQPDFAELEQQLREARRTGEPVILTEDDAHNIIDIRFFRPGPDGPLPPFPKPEPPRLPWPLCWFKALLDWVRRWLWWLWWPWWWFHCKSMTKAQEVSTPLRLRAAIRSLSPHRAFPFSIPMMDAGHAPTRCAG